MIENINDDDNTDGGDNQYVCCTIKGLFRDKNTLNAICVLFKGENLMRKWGLLLGE